MRVDSFGVSGFAVYVPPYRVRLDAWCEWTGNSWDKVRNVVGRSFRLPGVNENVYSMAATAVLKLIDAHNIDPERVGFLGFGTESSTDNAAGAVVIKGMVDRALLSRGLPALSRQCEVPEFKHACLGGIYALKAAWRFLACDGRGRQAIVVCSDLAEYERGTTGEPTQGAGAVALLVEEDPALFALGLGEAGSSVADRWADFRKPQRRFLHPGYAPGVVGFRDFPVFNGKYSTVCYVDQTRHAVAHMLQKLGVDAANFFEQLGAAFFHRPYHRMPATALAIAYLSGLVKSPGRQEELHEYCRRAEVDPAQFAQEAASAPDLCARALEVTACEDIFPLTMRVLKVFRTTAKHQQVVTDKLTLGADVMMEFGNLYTASLPVCMAAGLQEAYRCGIDLSHQQLLAVGYGSGDAAEAIPLKVVPRWTQGAQHIRLAEALAGAIDLTQAQYEALHDGRRVEDLPLNPLEHFSITRIGTGYGAAFQDVGIESYGYCAPRH